MEKVIAKSAAANAGLLTGDLIQALNGNSVANIKQFLGAASGAGSKQIELKLLRNQQPMEISIQPSTLVLVESAKSAADFKTIALPIASKHKLKANRQTSNEPLSVLTDGKLEANFGPVFGNGIVDGLYKMDLGTVTPVTAINSWSYQQGKNRGAQRLTIFASDSNKDPGWNLDKLTPIGTIDSGATKQSYTAASLQAIDGESLGSYRWIVWAVSPISGSGGGENTAFQELSVETR